LGNKLEDGYLTRGKKRGFLCRQGKEREQISQKLSLTQTFMAKEGRIIKKTSEKNRRKPKISPTQGRKGSPKARKEKSPGGGIPVEWGGSSRGQKVRGRKQKKKRLFGKEKKTHKSATGTLSMIGRVISTNVQ